MKFRGGVLGGAAGEDGGELIVGGENPLHLPRRLKALHDPLSSSGRLVGILRPIIETLVLPMLDAGHDFTLGRCPSRIVNGKRSGHTARTASSASRWNRR